MPKILLFNDDYPPYDRGGAARITYLQAKGLRDRGWQVGVFTSRKLGRPSQDSVQSEKGIKVYRLFDLYPDSRSYPGSFVDKAMIGTNAPYNPSFIPKINSVIKDFQPDVLHGHQISRISFGAFARSARSMPHFLTFHTYQFECPKGGLFRKRKRAICQSKPWPCQIYRTIMNYQLQSIDGLIAISHFIEDRLIRSGVDHRKLFHIPNGVVIPDSNQTVLPASSRDILFVGRLEDNKGVSTLIEAFTGLNDPEISLTVIGDGPLREHLQDLANQDKRIRFEGWKPQSELKKNYKACRFVVVPSRCHEVLNTVICEAQSWGRPVIATNLGGNPDLIQDSFSGYLIPHDDSDSLRAKMMRLLEDDALTNRFGNAAYNSMQGLSLNKHLDRLENLYQSFSII